MNVGRGEPHHVTPVDEADIGGPNPSTRPRRQRRHGVLRGTKMFDVGERSHRDIWRVKTIGPGVEVVAVLPHHHGGVGHGDVIGRHQPPLGVRGSWRWFDRADEVRRGREAEAEAEAEADGCRHTGCRHHYGRQHAEPPRCPPGKPGLIGISGNDDSSQVHRHVWLLGHLDGKSLADEQHCVAAHRSVCVGGTSGCPICPERQAQRQDA